MRPMSPFPRAPELLLGLPYTGAIDVWALGCVALDLFTGYPVYPGDSDYQMVGLTLTCFHDEYLHVLFERGH